MIKITDEILNILRNTTLTSKDIVKTNFLSLNFFKRKDISNKKKYAIIKSAFKKLLTNSKN